MQSLKSNALEPTRSELAALSRGQALARLLPVYGLPILTVLLIIFFSLLLPNTFPTYLNFRSILADKAIIALLSLAATLPMMAGRIDLTIGFGIVMWHILAMSLLVNYGVPWPLAILIVVACAALIGLINGLLVEVAQIDSFIATLGTGTILYALALWHTDGRQIIGVLPQGFVRDERYRSPASPFPPSMRSWWRFCWIVTERLPIGRHIYAIGANERAAALNGIPVRRYVIGVFVGSGIIAGFAGCILAAKLRIGQANVGLDYLLPALVGAFLGSTTIKPGRVNVWGTMCGVLILAVGISGIQQLGGAFFVEPLFNGTTLVISIALAGFAQRRPIRGEGHIRSDRLDRAGHQGRSSRRDRCTRKECRRPLKPPQHPESRFPACPAIEKEERGCPDWCVRRSAACLHRHHRARSEFGLGAGRRLHAGGEGLYRESDGARHHMGRTDDGPEGARGQACHLRLRRSEERGGQRRRRRRAGSGRGDGLGFPHPRRAGIGSGAHLGADASDRAES